MTNQPQADTTNPSYKMSNAVVSNKRVYMRAKDMVEIEKELETSRLAAENSEQNSDSSGQDISEPPVSPEPQANDSFEKRYKDLQSFSSKRDSEYKKTVDTLTQKLTDVENKLKETSTPQLPTSEEELQEWAKQFPPLYNIMRTIVLKEGKNDPELVEIKNSLKEVNELKQTIANERGKAELLKLHPDADEYDEGGSKNADFGAWYETQEPEIQALMNSGIPSKMARALTIYKEEKKIVTKSSSERKKDFTKAINVGPTQPNTPKEDKTWRESQVAKMSPREYEKYEPEIEKARSEGRYIRDLT